MRNFVLSSQAVTPGHPDKLSDQISDAMVDASLGAETPSACIAECALASGVVFLSLRSGGRPGFDPAALARRVLEREGYGVGTDGSQPTVMLDLVETPDLAGLHGAADVAADHMTTAFGYACDQTPEAMPLPVWQARRLCAELETLVSGEEGLGLAADAQAQVAVRFEDRRPVEITGVALGLFTPEPLGKKALEEMLRARVIGPAFEGASVAISETTRIVVTAVVSPGGPSVHAGLTGRKNSADFYGGFCRDPNSALSGKHPGRIDRIASYAARQAALSVVRACLAQECEVQLSYVPGDRTPASLEVDCFGSADRPEAEISAALARSLDFSPAGIAGRLGLWRLPSENGGRFYAETARKGHFGRPDMELPWERPVELDL
jgi:S-adenosylmethionine synthetase